MGKALNLRAQRRKIEQTKQFRKDWKRLAESDRKLVVEVVRGIVDGELDLGRPEKVAINRKVYHCRNYHVRGNLVLLYQITPKVVRLLRIGPHGELFR